MEGTDSMTTSPVPVAEFKIGDRVMYTDYCRGCDRDHDRTGEVVGFVPADVNDALGRDRVYVVSLFNAGPRTTHVFVGATEQSLTAADRRWGLFCQWCGEMQRADDQHDESECRDFYRRTGRPLTSDELQQFVNCWSCGRRVHRDSVAAWDTFDTDPDPDMGRPICRSCEPAEQAWRGPRAETPAGA